MDIFISITSRIDPPKKILKILTNFVYIQSFNYPLKHRKKCLKYYFEGDLMIV